MIRWCNAVSDWSNRTYFFRDTDIRPFLPSLLLKDSVRRSTKLVCSLCRLAWIYERSFNITIRILWWRRRVRLTTSCYCNGVRIARATIMDAIRLIVRRGLGRVPIQLKSRVFQKKGKKKEMKKTLMFIIEFGIYLVTDVMLIDICIMDFSMCFFVLHLLCRLFDVALWGTVDVFCL